MGAAAWGRLQGVVAWSAGWRDYYKAAGWRRGLLKLLSARPLVPPPVSHPAYSCRGGPGSTGGEASPRDATVTDAAGSESGGCEEERRTSLDSFRPPSGRSKESSLAVVWALNKDP